MTGVGGLFAAADAAAAAAELGGTKLEVFADDGGGSGSGVVYDKAIGSWVAVCGAVATTLSGMVL